MPGAAASSTAGAQADPSSIDLVVDGGRPLRVELDQRIRLQSVGQTVTGTVREPVYAYDRIVIPVGTRVRGHVSAIDSGSTFVRARAYLSGNLSPNKHAMRQFDALLLDRGVEVPIDTIVKGDSRTSGAASRVGASPTRLPSQRARRGSRSHRVREAKCGSGRPRPWTTRSRSSTTRSRRSSRCAKPVSWR